MNARFDVRRAQADLAAVEGRHRIACAKLQIAAVDLANAELALTLAKERARQAARRAKPARKPFAWLESWPFLTCSLAAASFVVWIAAQGWLA